MTTIDDLCAATGQFVTFGIDREVFAVPVESVLEIIEPPALFRVPEAPPHFAGLIDVRGRNLPVIDLRVKLGLPKLHTTESTRIMVLEISPSGRSLVLGVIADRVFEVAALDGGRLDPPPDIGINWRSNSIRGIGRRGQSFVVVFDLERLFSADDPALFAQATDPPRPPDPEAAAQTELATA
jgi:purine-binding chemotaxis protein CheW